MTEGKLFQLDIVTPEKILVSKKVKSVTLPGEVGSFQILFNHAHLLSNLVIGEIKIINSDGSIEYYATSGGFAEVKKNYVTVLVETAERSNEIDRERAEESLKRARERLTSKKIDINFERALASLERAKNRLKVSSRI